MNFTARVAIFRGVFLCFHQNSIKIIQSYWHNDLLGGCLGQGFAAILPDDIDHSEEVKPKQNQCSGIGFKSGEDPVRPVEHGVPEHGGEDAAFGVSVEPSQNNARQRGCEEKSPHRTVVVIFGSWHKE